MSKKYIIIEGGIGVGKTTLARALAGKMGGRALYEPAEGANPYLDKYYSDPSRWGFTMQIYLLSQRYRAHLSAQSQCLSGDWDIVSDRSIFGDRVFAKLVHDDKNMSDDDFKTYLNLSKDMCRQCLYPTMFLHITLPLWIEKERIARRMSEISGRECECAISDDYLTRLNAGIYDMMLSLENYTHVYTISGYNPDTNHIYSVDELADMCLEHINCVDTPNVYSPWSGVI